MDPLSIGEVHDETGMPFPQALPVMRSGPIAYISLNAVASHVGVPR